VIRAAGSEDVLLHSPLETVAVLFGVHPFLAEQARELAQSERTARA